MKADLEAESWGYLEVRENSQVGEQESDLTSQKVSSKPDQTESISQISQDKMD